MLKGAAATGEPLWTGMVGCRRVLSTDVPLRPCDTGCLTAWEALSEDGHDRSGQGRWCYP